MERWEGEMKRWKGKTRNRRREMRKWSEGERGRDEKWRRGRGK